MVHFNSPSEPLPFSRQRSSSVLFFHFYANLANQSGLTRMKKAVLQLGIHDDKKKKKAMTAVSGLSGVESITVDMKDKKLTVIGNMDPVTIASKLRKICPAEILSVGPAKEPEKKKEEPKKADDKKKDDKAELVRAYPACYPYLTPYYYARSAEEDPNACVIC